MTPERWKQIDGLVQAALEQPPERRAAFLDQACGDDNSLRREVRLLISLDQKASGFLEQPAFERSGEVGARSNRSPSSAMLQVLEEYVASAGALPVEEQRELGDYRLIREIGRGGMGVVYEAEQISLKRRVALKVLPFAAALDDRSLERFKNEARAAAVLHHQHIVPVYSVGCERGVHYYAMQLIEGRTLSATIRESRKHAGLEPVDEAPSKLPTTHVSSGNEVTTLPPSSSDSTRPSKLTTFRTAARLGVQAARALEYAHEVGVIHRDIKPANLMIDDEGELWITDFGLALIQSDARLTMTGDVMGTLRYMSPEQALGKRLVDHRTDIYSLGATLYELITLGPAFGGEDRKELLLRIALDEPQSLRRTSPDVPIELETIVLKAMAKNPDERYATARELGDDLQRFIDDEPIRARRPTVVDRVRKWTRRHRPIVATGAIAIVVLFVLALIGSLLSNSLVKRERDQARLRLFEAKLAEARMSRLGRQIGQRFASLRALNEAAQLARELKLGEDRKMELRNEAISCLALPDIRIVKEWEGWPPNSEGLAFDGQLELYAYSDPKGNISVRRVDDGRELARLLGDDPTGPNIAAPDIRFSPDSTYLIVRHHQTGNQSVNFRVWDWRLGKIVFQPPFTLGWLSADFNSDGKYIAIGSPDGMLAIHETATGNKLRQFSLTSPPSLVRWSPDDSRVAVITSQGANVEMRDVETGNLRGNWHAPVLVDSIAWSPDSTLIATGATDNRIYVWESATGKQHAVLQGHTSFPHFVQFSPRGDFILSSAWDGSSRLWDPWTGRELIQFRGDANRFSSDGSRMVSRGGSNISIWEVASRGEYRVLPWSPVTDREEVRDGGGLSPDGRWLAVAAGDVFRFWELNSGQVLTTITSTHAVDTAFHPSGDELFTSGHGGLYRWPWRIEPGLLRIGPPVKVPAEGYLEGISLDASGRTLAVAQLGTSGGASILDLSTPFDTVRRVDHPLAAVSTSVSPDGRWVATGVHKGMGIRIWEVSSGRMVKELIPNEQNTRATFSPDGKWLLTRTANEFCLWRVGSWERVRVERPEPGVDGPGSAAFTSDGKVLAITISPSVVQLIEVATWRPLARLNGPDVEEVILQGFNVDGSQLVVARTAGGVHVWDLRLIREQLRVLGLDWDHPPIPAKKTSVEKMPVRVEVDLGSFAQRK